MARALLQMLPSKLKPCGTAMTHDNNQGALPFSRRAFMLGIGAGGLGLQACSNGEETQADSADAGRSAGQPSEGASRVFVHPGLLHTEADFTRMREKVALGAQPWTDGWNALIANGRSQLGAAPRPLAQVVRGGDGSNFAQMYIDIARAYQLALRWKVSQDARYADQAVVFLNAWSGTLTSIVGNADRFLAAGIYGYQFANAAEIMRSYSGWAAEDFKRFQNMMLTVFYPWNADFLKNHNGAVITNYWANWDQCTLASMLSIGVLCDREDLYDQALAYYRNGQGHGAGLQAVYHVHPGNLGQWQESGRDQGHSTLGIGLAGAFLEAAWNQGDDLYSYDNHRFLAGARYVAKSNLPDGNGGFEGVPYLPYNNKQGYSTVLGGGLGIKRPVWELVLHHYEGRLGIAAPEVRQQALQLRPEYDGDNGDQLGFGTLTFARDPVAGARPSGLTARLQAVKVELSWWGVPDADSYTVKRGARAGGPYAVVATGVTSVLTWTDTAPLASAWYVVTAVNGAGESGTSNEVAVSTQAQQLLQLTFDETTGTAAVDATGQWPASKTVRADGWAAGRKAGHSVVLDGVADFIALPANVIASLSDFTIATWVFLDAATTWARVFDFGSGPRRSMFLVARNAQGLPQFSIDTEHGYVAQNVVGQTAVPTGQWTHLAVTLSGQLATLYVDGVAVGSKADVVYAPYHLGVGMAGFIGKSQYATDPLLKGKVDDFSIYAGALGAAAVAALATG
ncbi:Alginate lyase [Rhizobacter sp. OV335]|nr:Alginate lyase [Rhizobacter sp. OV335]